MGRHSHDIDIALDNVSGVEFAEQVHAYLRARGERTSSVGRIMANPDQSKHLETATMRVRDLAIDFVNLRSEMYAADSRIPVIVRVRPPRAVLPPRRDPRRQEIGTPEQDAMRRDLTINALFYNLNEGKVEDFTGKVLRGKGGGVGVGAVVIHEPPRARRDSTTCAKESFARRFRR